MLIARWFLYIFSVSSYIHPKLSFSLPMLGPLPSIRIMTGAPIVKQVSGVSSILGAEITTVGEAGHLRQNCNHHQVSSYADLFPPSNPAMCHTKKEIRAREIDNLNRSKPILSPRILHTTSAACIEEELAVCGLANAKFCQHRVERENMLLGPLPFPGRFVLPQCP